jgi:Na+-driven multidrug efflux pump
VATGIFSAMGDSRTPFIFLAISSVSNIAVDILFVKGIGMGVEGVAWATFLCQGVSGILAVIVVIRRLAAVETEGKFVIFSAKMLKKIAIIAIPSILQQSFISVGNIIIQRVINQYGESVIAGYAAAVKLNNLVITSFTTIGNGISNYTAQNLGAGQLDRIRQGLKAGIKMIWELCLPFAVLYFFLGKYGMYPFMENKTGLAVDTGVTYLRILAPFYFVVSAKLVADGILRGTGMMGRFMVSTFTDLILRVVLAIVLSGAMQSATGIWMSWPIGWTVASVLSLVFCITGIKKLTEGQLMQGGVTSR